MEKTFEQSKAFFAQPAEVKKSVSVVLVNLPFLPTATFYDFACNPSQPSSLSLWK